jgi:hypothetical protein
MPTSALFGPQWSHALTSRSARMSGSALASFTQRQYSSSDSPRNSASDAVYCPLCHCSTKSSMSSTSTSPARYRSIKVFGISYLQPAALHGIFSGCAIPCIDAAQVVPPWIEDFNLSMSGIPGVIAFAILRPPNPSTTTYAKEFALIENRWLGRRLSSHGWLCRCQRCSVRQSCHAAPLALLLLAMLVRLSISRC